MIMTWARGTSCPSSPSLMTAAKWPKNVDSLLWVLVLLNVCIVNIAIIVVSVLWYKTHWCYHYLVVVCQHVSSGVFRGKEKKLRSSPLIQYLCLETKISEINQFVGHLFFYGLNYNAPIIFTHVLCIIPLERPWWGDFICFIMYSTTSYRVQQYRHRNQTSIQGYHGSGENKVQKFQSEKSGNSVWGQKIREFYYRKIK